MTKYFALLDSEKVMSLGNCKNFDEADCRSPRDEGVIWIFSESSLRKLQKRIEEILKCLDQLG